MLIDSATTAFRPQLNIQVNILFFFHYKEICPYSCPRLYMLFMQLVRVKIYSGVFLELCVHTTIFFFVNRQTAGTDIAITTASEMSSLLSSVIESVLFSELEIPRSPE